MLPTEQVLRAVTVIRSTWGRVVAGSPRTHGLGTTEGPCALAPVETSGPRSWGDENGARAGPRQRSGFSIVNYVDAFR